MGNHRPYRDKKNKKARHFFRILRVFLRALRDFAVEFLNDSSA
jgi:hypothetical protein